MRSLALFVSYVLHPVFMLTYVTAFFLFTQNYFSYFMSPAKKIFLLAAVFIFSVALPLFNVALLKRMGYVKSLQMNDSSERFMPYVSTLILHAGLLYILHDLDIPFYFKYMIVASIAVAATTLTCNFFTRISAHAAGGGGLLAIVVFYEFISYSPELLPVCVTLGLCGLLGFARLYLRAHEPRQVYSGFAAGFASALLCLIVLLLVNYRF